MNSKQGLDSYRGPDRYTNQEAAQRLREVADILDVHPERWVKHNSWVLISRGVLPQVYAHCSIGWCMLESRGSKMYQALQRAINSSDIGVWNDDPERTVKEVILAFRTAADLLSPIVVPEPITILAQ